MTDETYDDILNLVVGGWGADDDRIAAHLAFIADIDLAEPDYSFELLRIYVRRSDGMLLWATDSGCSCPSPFEDVTVSELRESTLATFTDTFLRDYEPGYSGNSVAEVRRDITAALKVAKEQGAK